MKFSLWIHEKDTNGDTFQQGVVESGFFGNKRAAIDGLHPTSMRMINHTAIREVSYKIFKETSLTPVATGVLHSVSMPGKEKSEVNDDG